MPRSAVALASEISLVDDNLGEARLAIEVLRGGKPRNRISIVTEGEQAPQFLKGGAAGLLAEIPHIRSCTRLPVAVLTASRTEHDVPRLGGMATI
jgi:hypothetical protein